MGQIFTTRPEIRGTFGAVASTHWIATAIGMRILEYGGNAFDAAVATGFVLQIVEPHLNGPGGEVPIILHKAGEDNPRVICGQGVAPRAATPAAFRALNVDLIPGTGLLPAVVPGAFGAWMLLLRDYGTLSLRDVLSPAVDYAHNGYPLAHRAAGSIHAIAEFFTREWPSSAAVWLPGGTAPGSSQIVTSPAIAQCYMRIIEEAETAGGDRIAQIETARKTFYEGFVADAIDRHCRCEFRDDTGQRSAGFLTGSDLASWRAGYEDTLHLNYGGVEVHKTQAWGQGPVFLQTLALCKGFDLSAMDPNGAEFVHTLTECLKLSLADRDAYYGDPDFSGIPTDILLSPDYNDKRRAQITDKASRHYEPGLINNCAKAITALKKHIALPLASPSGNGEPTFADIPEIEGDTVHLDVVDRWGNMVAATPSGGWLQSSPAIPELGFNLSTRGQMFWLDENLPSCLAPGKRPRTTLTPTLITKDGAPRLAFGSPGGDQQDQWSVIFFLRHIHHSNNLQAAIDAPLFHTKHLINSFYPRALDAENLTIESRFDDNVLADLARRGHKISLQDDWSLGRLCAVARGKNGVIRAAATPRYMQAYAIGR